MGSYRNLNTKHCNRTYVLQIQIKCIQINLQHSRLATDNLRKIIEEDITIILCIQYKTKLLAYQKTTKFLLREKKEIVQL